MGQDPQLGGKAQGGGLKPSSEDAALWPHGL